MTYDVSASWSGSYPTLCYGEWEIIINGIELQNLENENFETFGEYGQWRMTIDWEDEFYTVEEGNTKHEWIDMVRKENTNNLITSLTDAGFDPNDDKILSALYEAINCVDWIHFSCGGCI